MTLLDAARERVRSASSGAFARNAGAMLLSHAGRALLQGASFLVLASALGADGFGAFSAVLAVTALAAPFAALGAVHLMIRSVVRRPEEAAQQLASALAVTALGGALATAAVTAATAWYLPQVPLSVVAPVVAAELLGALVVEVAAGAYTAREEMMRTAAVQLSFQGVRLLGALVLLVGPGGLALADWAWVYAATSLGTAAVVVPLVRRDVGRARPDVRGHLAQWRDGLLFSCGLASQAMYNDIDKAMLARLSTLQAAGAYTAAYRVVDMALTPLRAVLAAAYPRFFREGASGLAGSMAFVRRLAPVTVAYCALAGLALLAGAGLVPVVLGDDYAGAVGALRALAVLPLLKMAHYLAADARTGAGDQGVRSLWQAGVAVANVLLNLWLIPAHGLAGAVVASLVCDGVLALGLWGVVLLRLRHARRRSAGAPAT